MENLIKEISAAGVVPVVKLDDAANAVKLAEALRKGGLNCAEITFRTDAAEESIRLIAEKYQMCIRDRNNLALLAYNVAYLIGAYGSCKHFRSVF